MCARTNTYEEESGANCQHKWINERNEYYHVINIKSNKHITQSIFALKVCAYVRKAEFCGRAAAPRCKHFSLHMQCTLARIRKAMQSNAKQFLFRVCIIFALRSNGARSARSHACDHNVVMHVWTHAHSQTFQTLTNAPIKFKKKHLWRGKMNAILCFWSVSVLCLCAEYSFYICCLFSCVRSYACDIMYNTQLCM